MLFSCNDGDFEVPSMEFKASISECGDLLLYRLNESGTESIAISLSKSDFEQKVGKKIINLGKTIKVTYLIFDAKVGANYFCNNIPPTSPKVLQTYTATSGKIVLNAIEVTDDDKKITGYNYTIVLTDLILDNGKEKIGYASFDFGKVTRNL